MSDLTLALTGVESTTAPGSISAVGISFQLPRLSIAAGVGAVGAPWVMSLMFPAPILAIAGVGAIPDVEITAPAPVLAASGVLGTIGEVEITALAPTLLAFAPTAARLTPPVPALTVTGATGSIGAVSIDAAPPVLVAHAPTELLLLPSAPALLAAGTTGVVGAVSITTPATAIALVGEVPLSASAALTALAPLISVSGSAGVVGAVNLTLTRVALAIEGGSGVLGTSTLTVPLVQLSASGYVNVIGSVELTLPSLQLVMTGAVPEVIAGAGVSNTLAMHTEQLGLSTYSNYPFNSFARFNNVYLGACDAGLFTLTGATDNGALIQAAARVGATDFGTSHLKRVDRIYVGYRTTGDLVLRVYTDEVNVRDYRLASLNLPGLHGNHARLGKGLIARYYQFEVRNVNGADFELNMIELKPTGLRRRVGGRDA